MAKMNTYNIPIDLMKSTGIKMEAVSETEAVKQTIELLNNSDIIKKFTEYKIQEHAITCDQDDEIMEEVVKDFGLDVKERTSKDYFTEEQVETESFTHNIIQSWGGRAPKIENEPSDIVKSFASFCGCDIVFVADDRVIGLIQEIKFDTLKDSTLKMKLSIFSNHDEDYAHLRNMKDGKIVQAFANEYGNRMVREYNKVTFAGESYNPSIDTVWDTTTYLFTLGETPSGFKTPTDEEWDTKYNPLLYKK